MQERKQDGEIALPFPPDKAKTWTETGFASWYGGKFQGRLTANGEVFDTHKLSAAHKTLPFNTIVRVTNLENGKTIDVRINDRGPFVEDRIIDLSMAAAKDLGMVGRGVAKVSLRVLKMGDGQTYHGVYTANAGKYSIQVGSYSDRANAEKVFETIRKSGLSPQYEAAGEYIRVVLADITNNELDAVKGRLNELGIKGYIVRAVY
ncbi:MAG: septal ring lytic transglycosylase RlpA family protein [Spirochaetales bacterium]|nr:septal ring lytic transglycosylase RlpA family protein [Spirochaetales bacterium]